MKRYQIVLLSFALGIFAATFLGAYLLKKTADNIIIAQPSLIPMEYKTVGIFFSSTRKDPETLYCDKTYQVDRAVSRLSDNPKSALAEYAYLAVSELLKGPAVYEKEGGYFTSINSETKVQNIIIENGIATVDFNDKLSEGAAGSCRVQAIRSQIEGTLKQFPEVKEVIVTINGDKNVLQP